MNRLGAKDGSVANFCSERAMIEFPMSYRQIEEMMEGRGAEVDHSTLDRWVVKFADLPETRFRAGTRAVGSS